MSFISSLFKACSSDVIHYTVSESFISSVESRSLKAALDVLHKSPDRPDLRSKCLPSYTYSLSSAFLSGELKESRKRLNSEIPRGKRVEITCIDEVKIDAFYVPGSSQKAVLFLHGNGGFYETCWDQALDIKNMTNEDVHLMMFNPRGTGGSKGVPCGRNLSLDVMAAFLFLVENKKIAPSNILIYGHSMGGCIGALGAQLIQELYPELPINLVSDRSFSSMTDHLDAFSQRKDHPGFLARGVPRSEPIDGWEMDAIEAISTLKGRVCIIYHPEDEIIVKEASLFYQMKRKNLLTHPHVSCMELTYPASACSNNHSRQLYAEERKAFTRLWNDMLLKKA